MRSGILAISANNQNVTLEKRQTNSNALRGWAKIPGGFEVTKGGWGARRSYGVRNLHVNKTIPYLGPRSASLLNIT